MRNPTESILKWYDATTTSKVRARSWLQTCINLVIKVLIAVIDPPIFFVHLAFAAPPGRTFSFLVRTGMYRYRYCTRRVLVRYMCNGERRTVCRECNVQRENRVVGRTDRNGKINRMNQINQEQSGEPLSSTLTEVSRERREI